MHSRINPFHSISTIEGTMIVVRDVFQVQFGKMREVLELWKKAMAIEEQFGGSKPRILTDLVGQYYTLVLEAEFESMGAFETAFKEGMASEEWRKAYQQVVPYLVSGHREIFTIVA
jgi:hypothetical protein